MENEMKREKNINRNLERIEKRADRILEQKPERPTKRPVKRMNTYWLLISYRDGSTGHQAHAVRTEHKGFPLPSARALCASSSPRGWAISPVAKPTCLQCAFELRKADLSVEWPVVVREKPLKPLHAATPRGYRERKNKRLVNKHNVIPNLANPMKRTET